MNFLSWCMLWYFTNLNFKCIKEETKGISLAIESIVQVVEQRVTKALNLYFPPPPPPPPLHSLSLLNKLPHSRKDKLLITYILLIIFLNFWMHKSIIGKSLWKLDWTIITNNIFLILFSYLLNPHQRSDHTIHPPFSMIFVISVGIKAQPLQWLSSKKSKGKLILRKMESIGQTMNRSTLFNGTRFDDWKQIMLAFFKS